ncbi:MAG: type IV pilus inner membrane component PilO [Candidatus Aquicultorales bacterium]
MTKGKLNFVQQILIFAFLLVGAIALFYYFVWSPQAEQLNTLNGQRQQEEQKVATARAMLVRLEAVKKAAPRIEARIHKINGKLPKQPELPNFMILLQNVANDSGIAIASLKPSEPKDSQGFSSMDVSLQITGSYGEINDFLYRLENASRAVKVKDVMINLPAVEEYPDLAATVNLSTFILNDAPATQQVPNVQKPGATKT